MCTLTWAHNAQTDTSDSQETSRGSGYQIHFNRDESRWRSKALPPRLLTSRGIEYLAPIDQDAKGTWILVNSWGFSVCLLNHYVDGSVSNKSQVSPDFRSRGLLVKDLGHLKNIGEALAALDRAGIKNYASFDMYLFDIHQVHAIGWNGKTRTDTENPVAFKSSSGFHARQVVDSRRKHFGQRQLSDQSLREFHRSHTPHKSAYSVCMHREDARTQSYTEIDVSRCAASICYTDGPPCETALSPPLSLSLQLASNSL